MRKFITYLLIFFAAVVVIDQVAGLIGDYMHHHAKKGQIQQSDDFCLKDTHDVIIMGSSRAHHHYVPQILEDSLKCDVYNAGIDGNGIILAYGLLQLITERYNPSLIIYDVEPAFDLDLYNDDLRTRYLGPLLKYRNHPGVADVIKDICPRMYYESNSGLYRYNSDFIIGMKHYLVGGLIEEKGFSPLFGIMQQKNREKVADKGEDDSIKIHYLVKFINCCKTKNIKLILSLSPKFEVPSDKVQIKVKQIADDYGVGFMDYYDNALFMKDEMLFQEPMHLNIRGAELYTKMICSELSKYTSK